MSFISFRRYYLDQELNNIKDKIYGTVLDIGGKKDNRRGSFEPPYLNVIEWLYLNNDKNSNPDILAELPTIPLENNSVDVVICTEVIEYIYNYKQLLVEIKRVLKDDGIFILSLPFLHNLHADYESDYYRFTEVLIKKEIEIAGLNINSFNRMGGIFSVCFDLFRGYLAFQTDRTFLVKFLNRILLGTYRIFLFLDQNLFKNNFYINTGYFLLIKNKISNKDENN